MRKVLVRRVVEQPIATTHRALPDIVRALSIARPIALYVKDESSQRGRSVKGRVAYEMARQSLERRQPIVESSSGNLALALGYWCRELKAERPLCLVDDCCERPMLEALSGAGCDLQLISLTDAERQVQSGVFKRIAAAREYEKDGYWWPDQYGNPAWVDVHRRTTGPEIWGDDTIFDLVCGAVGTGATMSGVALSRPNERLTKIAAVEPKGSSMFSPGSGPYRVAGAGNPFRPENYRSELMDFEVAISDERTFEVLRRLRVSGLEVGTSGAMAVAGAVRVALTLDESLPKVLILLADNGWYEPIDDGGRFIG